MKLDWHCLKLFLRLFRGNSILFLILHLYSLNHCSQWHQKQIYINKPNKAKILIIPSNRVQPWLYLHAYVNYGGREYSKLFNALHHSLNVLYNFHHLLMCKEELLLYYSHLYSELFFQKTMKENLMLWELQYPVHNRYMEIMKHL